MEQLTIFDEMKEAVLKTMKERWKSQKAKKN